MHRILFCLVSALATNLCSAEPEPGDITAESSNNEQPSDAIFFSGDGRYRYEAIDTLGAPYDRQRVRARLGVKADVNSSTRAVFQLSTGEGDPRSAHITLSGGYSRKAVGIDLAYLNWHSQSPVAASLGKIPFPTWRPTQSLFTGGDFNPEGVALSYEPDSGFFATAYNFWLEDRSSASDSRQQGLQLGWMRSVDHSKWHLALTLNDFTDVKGQRPFLDGENSYGNSLNTEGALANDYRIADLAAEWSAEVYLAAITAFAHVARNTAADSQRDAYSAGLIVSTDVLSRWSAGYQYARVGRDALFGQHFDGDFGGGVTASRGHVLRLGFEPAARVRTRLSYFVNDVDQGMQDDFRLLQLDIDCFF